MAQDKKAAAESAVYAFGQSSITATFCIGVDAPPTTLALRSKIFFVFCSK